MTSLHLSFPNCRWRLARAALLAVVLPACAEAGSISYNFSETSTNTSQVLDATTPKGPLGTTIWNDSYARTAGTVVTGTETGLVDDTGTATSAAISWSSKNTWYGDGGTTSQSQRIVLGYLDDGDAGNGNPGCYVTVSNIPYTRYNVYGIVASDTGTNTTYTTRDFQINGSTWALGGASAVNATAFASMEATSANGAWVRIIPGSQTGNYWKLENVSGASLTIDGQVSASGARGSLAAIIIENVTDMEPDNMPDDWEAAHGLSVGVNDAALDADGDGLLNLQEFQQRTDPQVRDSDADGLEDGPEVDPANGTYPLDPDSDDDGLSDGQEVLTYHTKPLDPDSDDDELPDAWEVLYHLDPNDDGTTDVKNGQLGDSDGDHLDNFTEFGMGTDPTKKDTDGDGLYDDEEFGYSVDPLDPDSDGDGLQDGEEVEPHHTDPSNPDSDDDKVDDGDEIRLGYDPNDPASTPTFTAPITWTVQKNLLSDADIALNGDFAAAYVFGKNDLSVTIGSELIPFTHAGGNTGTFFTAAGGDTGNASLNQLLNSHEAKETGEWSYRITGLTPGQTYQVQVIAGADRRAGISTRTQVIGDGLGGVTGDLTRSGPGTAIGTFTASELGTQIIDVLFGSVDPIDPAISALIVREVTLSTLELSSFALNPETQEITLTWVSEADGTYDIEYSDDLQTWLGNVNAAPIPATGLSTSYSFPKPANTKRFFRVTDH